MYIVLFAFIWWLLVAIASRVEMSSLQIPWDNTASLYILLYFPACILFGFIPVLLFPLKPSLEPIKEKSQVHNFLRMLFCISIALFFLQSLIYVPPAFNADPSLARLEWGFKYIHVVTEILVRVGVLACVGVAVTKGRISFGDLCLMLTAETYAILVVSRGLIFEFFIYFIFASVLISNRKYFGFSVRKKHVFSLAMIWLLFVIYGEWRQGDDFSISQYGGMLFESHTLAWIFGYFLVNLDNLALVIMENFHNHSVTNVFGPILQSLQILNYKEIDDYLYVGKFNLGTALRPFVIDYGSCLGGFVFAMLWSLALLLPNLCYFSSTRFAVIISLAYMSLLFPVTGRIEQPPYLFPLLLIIFVDRFYWLLTRIHKKAALRSFLGSAKLLLVPAKK